MACRYFAFGADTNRFCLANAGLAQTNGGYDPYYTSLFSGGTSFKGQTPSISASYAFDLNFPLKL